jgi:hypothetical protein
MLDAVMYNLMMETQAAIFAAASASGVSVVEARETPPALVQVNAGRAESPGWFLVQAAEFEPEPLTVANLRVRDVYAAPRMVQALLDLMASAGWLEHDGRDNYALTPAGRTILQRSRQRLQTRLAVLAPPLAINVEDLSVLLGRVIASSLAAPTPPGTWCLAHSRWRAPARNAPALAQVMHYFDDFNAFRDDAHMAAWRPHAVEGYACLTHGTADGVALHTAVERATDQFLYDPWTCLSDDEMARLKTHLELVRHSVGEA